MQAGTAYLKRLASVRGIVVHHVSTPGASMKALTISYKVVMYLNGQMFSCTGLCDAVGRPTHHNSFRHGLSNSLYLLDKDLRKMASTF